MRRRPAKREKGRYGRAVGELAGSTGADVGLGAGVLVPAATVGVTAPAVVLGDGLGSGDGVGEVESSRRSIMSFRYCCSSAKSATS
jgi:hypothetical protein